MPLGSTEKDHSPLEEHPRTDTRTDLGRSPAMSRGSVLCARAGGLSREGSQGSESAPSFLRGELGALWEGVPSC